MFDENYVLRGSELPEALSEDSIGVSCYKKLKKQPEDRLLLTEAQTGRTCTSREFLKLSIDVAAGLRNLGVEPGDIICLVGSNTININATAVGVLLIGAVWCPIDPSLKSFEYQHLIRLFEPKLIFCDSEVVPIISEARNVCGFAMDIICFEETDGPTKETDGEFTMWDSILIDTEIDDFEPTSVDCNEMAILACSSGSTGLPKGVSLTHKNLQFEVVLGSFILEFLGELLFIHTSHFFWVSGIFAFLLSVCLSLRRVLVADVTPENVMRTMQEYKAEWGLFAPSVVNGIVHHPDVKSYDLSSMKAIITAGSPMNKATVSLAKEIFGSNLKMTAQAYGLSELSGCYTAARHDLDPMCVGSINYGTAMKIMDPESGNSLPPGQEGEICCQSIGMMKEYYRNPKATSDTIDEDGWLHTGDIGYISQEGSIYITGRVKELMKLDNHQIAPAEIEQVINTVPGVADVAVAGIKVSEDNSYPMALVVKQQDFDLSEEDIIKCVNGNLSEFKQLRGGVCFVDNIPRTLTGKIKRLDLQTLANELYMGDTEYIL